MRKLVGGVLVLVALLGVACGGDDDPTVSGSETTVEDMDDHGGSSATCSPSGATVSVVASQSAFDKDCLAAPADQAFKLSMDNKDTVGHSLVILESHSATEPLFRADVFSGPKVMTFDVPALKAGTYAFHCEVHPSRMAGTFVVA